MQLISFFSTSSCALVRAVAGERVVALLQKHRHGKVHIDAAGGQRSGLGCHQADADRSAILGHDQIGNRHAGNTRAGNA